MKKRWLLYVAAGILFGVLDWYYLDGLANFPWGGLGESVLVIPVILFLNYGIWIFIVAPVAIIEVRRSGKLWLSALAGAITWSSAIFSYYSFYTLLMAFAGLPHMEYLLFSNRDAPSFWQEWTLAFQRIILAQFLEWILIALIGGSVLGLLIGYSYKKWQATKWKPSHQG